MNCERPQTPKVAAPPNKSIEEWVRFGPAWAVSVLKVLSEERRMRKLEQDCAAAYRKQFLEWDTLPGTLSK